MAAFQAAFNKKEFLEWIAKQIPEDYVILITTHFNNAEYVKKTDSKNINFQFPAFPFIKNDGVKDVFEALKFGTLIMEREHFKQGLLDVVDGKAEEFKDSQSGKSARKKRIK